MRDLPTLSHLADSLLSLISSPASAKTVTKIASLFTSALVKEGFITQSDISLEECAYAVNAKISDHTLRNLHILSGV